MDYIKKIERLEKENELYKRQNKGIRDCTIASMKERVIEVIKNIPIDGVVATHSWMPDMINRDELITKIKGIK